MQVLRPLGGETISGDLVVDWEAADPDGDPLRYTVQYSPDLGSTWQTLATSHFTPTLTVSGDALAGSEQALIRVIANDGVNTAMAQTAGGCKTANATSGMPMQWQVACIMNGDYCESCSAITSS